MTFASTTTALLAMAAFGLTGSLHCAAMCGALSASGCGSRAETIQYHLTRVAAYTVLGFAAGLLTVSLLSPWLDAIGRYLGVAFGVLMMAYALGQLVHAWRGKSLVAGRMSARLYRQILRLPFPRSISLGLATAFLPCGFLLAALLQAALLAHPVVSALGMFVFALSSSPALLVASGVSALVRRRAPRAAAVFAALLLLASSGVVFWRALLPPHAHAGQGGHESHHVHP